MLTKLAHVTVIVRDQDEALRFYTDKLGMEKREDNRMGDFRWLTVAPKGSEVAIVLQRPGAPFQTPELAERMLSRVGEGTTWVVETNDCRADHAAMAAKGVTFRESPTDMPWGVSAVFEDLYGNPYNLLQTHAQ
ncbi:MAG TPA: VOC family protein [Kofleriaceae bacterium]|jgi:catechol 2,3-dioxygenase-like lactoylglutathione lyase family enzyme|nr:VOC family protein [Kofleriaceae bacterium]